MGTPATLSNKSVECQFLLLQEQTPFIPRGTTCAGTITISIGCMMRVLGQTETVPGRRQHFSHTTAYQQHFTSAHHNGFRTQEHFSPHHRRCTPHAGIFKHYTHPAESAGYESTFCRSRPWWHHFFVLRRVSAVSFVATIYRNLPDGCHKVFNTYIHKMELHYRNDVNYRR